jgi:hypothetical protein
VVAFLAKIQSLLLMGRHTFSGQDPFKKWIKHCRKRHNRQIPSVEFDLLKLDVCSVRPGIGGIPGTLLGPAPVIKCGSGKFPNSMKESHLLYNIYEHFPLPCKNTAG